MREGPVSFAHVVYRALDAYRFVNAAGEGRWAHYHWEPEAGHAMTDDELTHLFESHSAEIRRHFDVSTEQVKH